MRSRFFRIAPQSLCLGLTTLAALTSFVGRPAAAQGLNGQPVMLTYRSPDASTTVTNIGTQTVTNAGTTFLTGQGASPFMTVIVTPSQIEFMPTPPQPGFIGFGNAPFIGYAVSEVGLLPVNITGVSIDPATSVSSFMLGTETFGVNRVTFDAHNVFVNLQGLQLSGASNVTLDLTTAPAPVPEASTAVSFGLLLVLGPCALVAARRRKRLQSQP